MRACYDKIRRNLKGSYYAKIECMIKRLGVRVVELNAEDWYNQFAKYGPVHPNKTFGMCNGAVSADRGEVVLGGNKSKYMTITIAHELGHLMDELLHFDILSEEEYERRAWRNAEIILSDLGWNDWETFSATCFNL